MSSRSSPENTAWRKAVKQRDGRYCQWPDCKRRGQEVHHIIPWSVNPSLRYAVNNGIFFLQDLS